MSDLLLTRSFNEFDVRKYVNLIKTFSFLLIILIVYFSSLFYEFKEYFYEVINIIIY